MPQASGDQHKRRLAVGECSYYANKPLQRIIDSQQRQCSDGIE
jgi:hypothetical protein